MKYVIDELELRNYLWDKGIPAHITHLNDFLKSKKPVTEIASGKLVGTQLILKSKIIYLEGLEDELEKYDGNPITIYVESA